MGGSRSESERLLEREWDAWVDGEMMDGWRDRGMHIGIGLINLNNYLML